MYSRISNRRPAAGLLAAITLVVLSVGGGAVAQEQPIKIAVVDLDFVAAESPAGKALAAKLEKFRQESQTELAALQEAADAIRRQVADGASSLSDARLAELQQEYEDAVRDGRRAQESKQREGQRMQTEGLKEIEEQLRPVFEKIRDDGEYDLILNNAPGVVVMSKERIDISQKVIEALSAASAGGS